MLGQYEDDIDELSVPTYAVQYEAVSRFRAHTHQHGERDACAGCGQIFSVNLLCKHSLGSDDLTHLKKNDAFTTEYNARAELGKSAHNVSLFNGQLFAIVPDLVKVEYSSALFCFLCLEEEPKNHARFLDFDTGRPSPALANRTLSHLNQLVIQPRIIYSRQVKLSSSSGVTTSVALKSHTFPVMHDDLDQIA